MREKTARLGQTGRQRNDFGFGKSRGASAPAEPDRRLRDCSLRHVVFLIAMFTRRHTHPLTLCLGLLFSTLLGHAETESPEVALPQPLDMSFAESLIANPPFTRSINLSDSLQLTGLAYIDGRPVVTVKDTVANKTHVVTEEPNDLGWTLVETIPGSRLDLADVRLMIDSEIIAVQYSNTQMAPTQKSGTKLARVPTPEEFTGRDSKGPYVRAYAYLSDADRDKVRQAPREVRDKFLQVVHDQRDKLFKASHEQRAAFIKKTYDSMVRR